MKGGGGKSVEKNTASADAGAARAGTWMKGTGGDILAECLRAAGAEYVFNVNSTGQSPFYDALMTRPDLKLIVALQEGQAVSMAQGYELASGRPGILMLPSIGMPNALSNIYNAWKDRSSLVIFSDGSSTELTGCDGFQQVDDWLSITASFTKWQWAVEHPDRIAEMVRRGIKRATTPIEGPVYVRLPSNVMATANVEATIYPQSAFETGLKIRPEPQLIEQAARMLIDASFPMINAGPEITRSGANRDLVELAELLSIPVAQGFSVYCDFPYRHPLFAGFYSMGYPLDALRIDTFLNLGAPMPGPSTITVAVPETAKVIDARLEYEKIANNDPTDIAIAAGAKETTRALIDAITSMTTRSRRNKLRDERLAVAEANMAANMERQRQQAEQGWDASPMYAERLYYELDTILEEDACVIVETGDRRAQAWINFGPGQKTLIGPTSGFALGWGVGASLGVKIARPDQQVVALIGDGAFMFAQIESLWTASRYDIPVTIVVLNNRSYDAERGRIHFASHIARSAKSAWKDMSCYLGDPDINFVKFAQAFDIEGQKIERPEDIRSVFERAFAANRAGRPFLVDVAVAQRGPGANQDWHPGATFARGN